MLLLMKLGATYVKPANASAAAGSVGVPQGLSIGRCSVQILSKFSTLCSKLVQLGGVMQTATVVILLFQTNLSTRGGYYCQSFQHSAVASKVTR